VAEEAEVGGGEGGHGEWKLLNLLYYFTYFYNMLTGILILQGTTISSFLSFLHNDHAN
jgi:hypothetical protein